MFAWNFARLVEVVAEVTLVPAWPGLFSQKLSREGSRKCSLKPLRIRSHNFARSTKVFAEVTLLTILQRGLATLSVAWPCYSVAWPCSSVACLVNAWPGPMGPWAGSHGPALDPWRQATL